MPEHAAPIGILGGTFDPIHFGHLRLAEVCADACALSEVRLLPAALPNLRDRPSTPAEDRLRMVRLAVQGNARLAVDDRELRRPGVSYTVDTLLELRAELGPTRALCLLLGADAFLRLPAWSRWLRLFELAHIVVVARFGAAPEQAGARAPELDAEWRRRASTDPRIVNAAPAGAIVRIDAPLLDISATHIRQCLERGASVRYLLPDLVLRYIEAQRLYGGK